MTDTRDQRRQNWMTDDQWACAEMLAEVVRGHHHINGTIHPWGDGIKVSVPAYGWSTFDFDKLTRLVVYAHARAVRVEIVPSAPRRIGMHLFKRKRDGGIWARHPTLTDALKGMGMLEETP